jgi:hypothetical protein
MREINRGRMPQFPPRKKTTPNVLDGSVKKTQRDPADLLPGRNKRMQQQEEREDK